MAKEDKVAKQILKERVIAILRLPSTDKLEPIVDILIAEGFKLIEITLNSKNALDRLFELSKTYPQVSFGAGTVIGYDAAVKAIESGAKFLASPVTDLDMLAVAKEVGVTSIAGALTPTEAWQATAAGASFVKPFPLVGLGPQFIRALRGPFPDMKLIPTNGVTLENIPDFLEAGVAAIGVGSPLVTDRDIESGHLDHVRERARAIMSLIKA